MSETCRLSVAVFAKNEQATIADCVAHVARAAEGTDAILTVVLNGSTDGTAERLCTAAVGCSIPMRVVAVDFADKSHAWNLYIHALRPLAETHVFVDGYALVTPDAFTDLAGALARTGAAAAAAMPVCGRSAALQRAVMREHGGLMGALHALSGSFVERIAAAGLRLPLGLYRGDGLVGSMVVHDLDAHGRWEPARIAIAHRATWHQPETSLWSLRDLRRHANRKVQQARGRLEDAAIRSIIYREGYAGLPRFADQMVLDWLAEDPARRPSRTDLAGQVALRRLRLRRTPFGAELAPRRLVDTVGTSRSFA